MIHDISQLTQAPSSVSTQTEYPSSAFVDAQTLICADGRGTLAVLTLSSADTARPLGVYELPKALNASSSPIPFRLHTALSADGQAVAVLSFKRLTEPPPDASSGRKTTLVEFDIVAVRIPLQAADSSDAISPLDVLWHRRGSRVPFYTAYDKRRRVLVLAGGSPYRQIGQPTTERHDHPSSNDDEAPAHAPAPDPASPSKPPPYAWTQDSEEITVAFPFPSSTPKANITVLFSPQTLTLLVQGCDPPSPSSPSPSAPRYAAARLWGGIAPSSSFWTWDAHGARTYGLLTLHLEKQHAGTRWPHLFDTTTANDEPEVPETLDPSELYAIRESLEKYTAALQERVAGGGIGGDGSGGAMPSLADGEVDQEVDAAVGTETCVTWVAAAAAADGDPDPGWAREDWDVPFIALSAPLPGISDEISMVVKHTIDGLLFVLSDEDKAGGTPAWTHSSTFSALAFVLASKRDTRFTYHVPSKAVLAFEGGGPEYGGNLYIYRDAKPKSNLAKQAILKLAGHTSGSLLGVGAIRNGEEIVILCLCERELLVLRNVL